MNALKVFIVCMIPMLAAFQGCPDFDLDIRFETFSHPLVDPDKSVAPDEIIGSFKGKTESSYEKKTEDDIFDGDSFESFESTPYFHVGRAGGKFPKGFLRIVCVEVPHDSSGTISTSSQIFFVKKIGKRYIAHLPIVDGELLEDEDSWDASKCDGYTLVEIRLSDDSMELRFFNFELLDKLIESKVIKVETGDDDHELITNNAESLTEIINKYGDKLFSEDSESFARVKRQKTKR